MKRLLLSSILLSLSASLCIVPRAAAQELVVHEWGTFTTLQGSNGIMLSGLYRDEEELPPFVYSHGGFSPQPTDYSGKGFYANLGSVTVKMETPVLYFYAPVSMPVGVRVDFPRGSISQWYPQRSGGETSPEIGSSLEFCCKPYNGWISWNATVLAPDANVPLTPKESQLIPTWTAPRATDANLVKGSTGEVEKYLFYRGIGNFKVPLHASFNAQGNLVVRNNGREPIPFVLVYDKPENGPAEITWTGALAPDESHEVGALARPTATGEPDFTSFEDALVEAGLYRKEAAAMLKTWHTSYFETPGLKVFWIVPRSITDTLLPITVTPTPRAMERVLVGRSEVLTPEFEEKIFADFKAKRDSIWRHDRYYVAYKSRAQAMGAFSSVEEDRQPSGERQPSGGRLAPDAERLRLYPNPTQGSFMAVLITDDSVATVEMTDILGRRVLQDRMVGQSRPVISISSLQKLIDLSGLPRGLYFFNVRAEGKQWLRNVIKH